MKLISALGTVVVLSACGYQTPQVNAATTMEMTQSPQKSISVQSDKPIVKAQQITTIQATNNFTLVEGEPQMSEAIFEGRLTSEPSAKGLSVRLTIHNPRQHDVAIQYRSGMTADLWLVDAQGKRLWAWSNTMMFTQALRDTIVTADKTFSVNFTIPNTVLSKMPQGILMQAKYAGIALEVNQPAMADITAPLPIRLMVR